jgi:hypothetical protein
VYLLSCSHLFFHVVGLLEGVARDHEPALQLPNDPVLLHQLMLLRHVLLQQDAGGG